MDEFKEKTESHQKLINIINIMVKNHIGTAEKMNSIIAEINDASLT